MHTHFAQRLHRCNHRLVTPIAINRCRHSGFAAIIVAVTTIMDTDAATIATRNDVATVVACNGAAITVARSGATRPP